MPARADNQPDTAQGDEAARPRLPGSGLVDGVLRSLKVRQEEHSLVLRLAGIFAVVQASHGLGTNTADALFFARFGVDRLPLMILMSGPMVMAITVLHATGLAVRGARAWLWSVVAAAAAIPALGWLAILTVRSRPVYAVIWIANQMVMMLTFTVVWNAAGSACTTRQAKRLFPLFATAGVGGGVIGNLLTGPLASGFGAPSVLLVQAGLLGLGAFGIRRCRRFYRSEDTESRSAMVELRQGFDTVRRTPLMQMTAWAAFATSLLFFLVVFPFSDVVANTVGSEDQVAGFLGVFSSVATAATFLVSLLLTNRLFARFGIVWSFLAVPAVYVLGFAWWLTDFDLAAAATVRGLQWVAVNAIGGTAFTALFNVLTGERRGQVMAFITAVPSQLGTVAAGALLLAGSSLPQTVRFVGGLVIAVATAALVIRMKRAYVEAIVTAVRRGLVGVFTVAQPGLVVPVDGDARRVLEAHLADVRPEARAIALSGLARLDERGSARLEAFMDDDSPLVRSAAFASLCTVEPARIDHRVSQALADPDPAVRLQAVRYIESLDPSSSPDLPRADGVELPIGDPDLRVRAAAAMLAGGPAGEATVSDLLASGNPIAVVAVLTEGARPLARVEVDPRPYLSDHSAAIRASAVAHPAARRLTTDLVAALDDVSLGVRALAARALAETADGRALLLEVLDLGSVRASDAALRALVPATGFDTGLAEWAGREASRAAHLQVAASRLNPDSATGRYLVRVLEQRAARLIDWVLLAVTTLETRPMMSVVERGIRSGDSETRAQAIEALQSVGERSVLTVLLPLLESDRRPGRHDPDVLRSLSNDFDPWIRALAVRCLAEQIEADLVELSHRAREDHSVLVRQAVPSFVHMSTERLDVLGTVERVLALQRVPMFGDLDPEDLELIAGTLSEVHFDRGSSIFRDGDPGDVMLLIVSGNAVVSKSREEGRYVIHTYGPGDHVGELALLGGGPRSADVHAGEGGLEGLTLGKADLLSILDERPTAAVGMLGTLARRLVEQT